MASDDTIVALATPSGESAIALIRLSGSLCKKLIVNVFRNKNAAPRMARMGLYEDRNGKRLDQVLYTYFEKDASYTGAPVLEISTHGNPFIVQKIIQDLLRRGCRMAEPGEFTRNAFLNGKLDLSQAEAVIDLIRARSERALATAGRQLKGSVKNKVNTLIDKLLDIISHLEAYIDFPEEDLPEEDTEGPTRQLNNLCREMEALISTSQYSTLLHEGIKTVIIGEPNAGKSSLLNALLGEERVLVSEEPGTTRDFVEESLLLGPYRVRFVDTAGLRESGSKIEQMGMQKTLDQLAEADFSLFVLDRTRPPPSLSRNVSSWLREKGCMVVENKMDVIDGKEHKDFLRNHVHLSVSALTGEGIPQLKTAFINILEEELEIPEEDAVVVNTRHADALTTAKACLHCALAKMKNKEPAELIASDLRSGLEALGGITGEIDNERMLDRLFKNFCIGK